MEFIPNFSLADLTTFRIGGPAKFYVEASTVEELQEALQFARQKQLPIFVLGRGSNILISDDGFDGLVIHNKIRGLQITDQGLVTVGSGENWDNVIAEAVRKNLSGIECLSGIPGSAGGGVVQNIGAYGQTLSDRIVQVRTITAASGQEKIFSKADCQFNYRTSFFKNNPGQFIVVNFQLQLEPDGEPSVTYPDLIKFFEGKPKPSLEQVRQAVIQIRANKGYLIMPGYESFKTAGSYFKNPVVSQEQFEKLRSLLGDENSNRYWPFADGVKISAAFLMQEAGFSKGYREGEAGISPKHSLSLVNLGQAKALDIKSLAQKIKSVVLQKFGVELEEEVIYI